MGSGDRVAGEHGSGVFVFLGGISLCMVSFFGGVGCVGVWGCGHSCGVWGRLWFFADVVGVSVLAGPCAVVLWEFGHFFGIS